MDPERIIRIAIAGWVLVLSSVVHFWIFGGDPAALVESIPSNQLVQAAAAVLVSIAAGPVLGLFVSGWTALCRSWQYHLPSKTDEAEQVFVALQRLLPNRAIREELDNVRADFVATIASGKEPHLGDLKRNLEPFITFIFHRTADSSVVEFCTRRWTLFWMWANSIFALLIGVPLGLLGRLWADRGSATYWREFDGWRIGVEILVLLSVVPGVLQGWRLRSENEKMLRQWLFTVSDVPARDQLKFIL